MLMVVAASMLLEDNWTLPLVKPLRSAPAAWFDAVAVMAPVLLLTVPMAMPSRTPALRSSPRSTSMPKRLPEATASAVLLELMKLPLLAPSTTVVMVEVLTRAVTGALLNCASPLPPTRDPATYEPR